MATRIWISTSSNDFNTAGNWSGTTVPVASDIVVFDGTGTAALTTNINQSTVAFAAIYIYQANTANIGSLSAAGVATYFQHQAPLVYIGQGVAAGTTSPSGSPLILLDNGSTTCTVSIADSATLAAVNTNLPPIQLKGTALTLDITGGIVGVACRDTETATVTYTISQGSGQTVQTPALFLGTGVTTTSGKVNAGTVLSRVSNTVTALTIDGGTVDYQGTGAMTTLSVNSGGTIYYSGTGTVTTLNLAGTFSRERDGRSITLTNTNLYKGASLLLNNGISGSTTLTNSPAIIGCGMQDITISTPPGVWI